ncbi:MAG: SH3 domain-containing protein [Lachnospiraceae bacterium]|nr:SH3 domain-containing protein [Lachnospiraceae bacterium]
MKKRLYLIPLVTLTTAFVLIGCNGCNTETVEGTDESIIFEETNSEKESMDFSDVEETTESMSEDSTEGAVEEEQTDLEENDKEEVATEDSPIVPMDTVLYVQREVNVRSGPGTDYEKLGALAVNTEVTVTGQDKESGWYQIEYEETVGFVSDAYLGEEKVEVTIAPNSTVEQTSEPASSSSAASDNGESSDSWFDGDDMMDALQWHQQMTP